MRTLFKKYWKKIIVGITIVILSAVLIKTCDKSELYFNTDINLEQMNNSNYILNKTNIDYLDTIIITGLYKLDINYVIIMIKDLNEDIEKQLNLYHDINIKAVVVGEDPQYVMYIKDDYRDKHIDIISHELIHIQQYNNGELINLNNRQVIWQGDTLTISDIPYFDREWERDAYYNQVDLYNNIKEILY